MVANKKNNSWSQALYPLSSWWLLNMAFACCLYLGLVKGLPGVQNMIKFFVVYELLDSTAFFLLKGIYPQLAQQQPQIPGSVELGVGIGFALILAYFGWFSYAALCLASHYLASGILDRLVEARHPDKAELPLNLP